MTKQALISQLQNLSGEELDAEMSKQFNRPADYHRNFSACLRLSMQVFPKDYHLPLDRLTDWIRDPQGFARFILYQKAISSNIP